MKSLGIAGIALALAMTPQLAIAKGDSAGARAAMAGVPHVRAPGVSRWSHKRDGRWLGGWNAPGGWANYRAPVRGWVLPSYWINPAFYLGNFSRYGFARPQPGYGWSRYFDDAVLTDRDGRVIDSVRGVDWDRYGDDGEGYYSEDYSDSYGYREDAPHGPAPRPKDRDGGLGGALAGAAVGAVAGGVIAGKGDHLAGALVGGGVGAVAGALIDKADNAGRGYRAPKLKHGKHRKHRDHEVAYDGRWQGEWRGSYDGGPERVYRGEYDGRFDGYGPHWGRGHGRGANVYHHGGRYGYGWGWGGPEVTVITVQSQPVTYTTTTTTEEVIYSKSASSRKRVWKPRAKRVWKPRAQCVCR